MTVEKISNQLMVHHGTRCDSKKNCVRSNADAVNKIQFLAVTIVQISCDQISEENTQIRCLQYGIGKENGSPHESAFVARYLNQVPTTRGD